MGSEALALALALYRAPNQRHALRTMALPHDIGLVLQLASAPQPLLHNTANEVGETEGTIVEASRFYLQQALFQPDANAYRLLGLLEDATPERIREHHRLLQRWLHPDRRGEDWEALFAMRVNWAWAHLRSEAARHAYDIECGHSPEMASTVPQPAAGPLAQWSLTLVEPEHGHRARWMALGLSLCSCAGLLYMVLTRDDRVPLEDAGSTWTPVTEVRFHGGIEPSADSLAAKRSTAIPIISSSGPQPLQVSGEGGDAKQPSLPSTPPSGQRLVLSVPSIPDREKVDGRIAPQDVNGTRGDGLLQPADRLDVERPALPPVMQSRSASRNELVSKSLPQPAIASGLQTTADFAERGVQARAPADSVAAHPTTKILAESRSAGGTSGRTMVQEESGRPVAPIVVRGAVRQPAASTHIDANPTASVRAMGLEDRSHVVASNSVDDDGRQPISTIVPTGAHREPPGLSRSGQDTTSLRGVVESDVLGVSADALARIGLARQRVKDLSAFFGDFGTRSPPVWNDVGGETSAERQRSALHERARSRDSGNFAVDAPMWHMSENSASLRANYHLQKGHTVSESGRFSLNMIWRERMWLVTHVELEPAL